MKKKYSQLMATLNDHPVTQSDDPEFWFHLQHSLLMALKEQELISMEQYCNAEDKLNRKRKTDP
jgi:hypothetical protein